MARASVTRVIHIHRRDLANAGDRSADPFIYFAVEGIPVVTCDIETLDPSEIGEHEPVVVGGGGLIDCLDRWNLKLNTIAARSGPTIGWGIGHNQHYDAEGVKTPLACDRFVALGVRDRGPRGGWVPCPSCLMPELDVSYAEERVVGVFWHKHFRGDERLSRYECLTNRCSPEEAVKFIGTSRVVVTNSYHGLYWAVLLNRRVFLHRPFSTKFDLFPFDVLRFDEVSFVDGQTIGYDGVLERCRSRNVQFASDVAEYVGHSLRLRG